MWWGVVGCGGVWCGGIGVVVCVRMMEMVVHDDDFFRLEEAIIPIYKETGNLKRRHESE